MKHFWFSLLLIFSSFISAADDVYFSKIGIEDGL